MPLPASIRCAKAAAKLLGVKFPPDYVLRITRENGGTFSAGGEVWELYPVFDDSDRRRLKRTCDHVVRQTLLAREDKGFPPRGVVIGHHGTGERLIFLAEDDGFISDEISWWDSRSGELEQRAETFTDA